ncbi:MAG TPA: cytochrome C [Sulfurihydrogenibium sp.]|uniref:cytochrome P460 family protein n=1 Tax=Sulfurihydrogenibium sp. (strain YO3AOP1) TaxID=436114 RepID=UPI0001726662|nr:cytochrome P460 family protein [Sulfurihydrogenibium sp. YO3AOP1]ACD66903.1 cytochrome c' [Sulfurihydrogenibium sp. YO3AOP1]HBT98893.1 cytochrome C [Sulfurihydrogenibium sp.]
MKSYLSTIALLLIGIVSFSYSDEFKVKPDVYRNWHHVKSMVIFDEKHPLYNPFNGIHHVYVNDKGLNSIKNQNNRKFPDGTKIAIVFYEHVNSNGAFIEGAKRIEAFMVKDSKKFKSTDGWGYYGYDGNGKNLIKDMSKDCHSCHMQAKDKDFVFSIWTK